MADDPLFSLKQLADQLGLPESTVRYYRDAFLDHIPSVGTGRRRRYPAQAIAVLRTIARHYAAGKPRAEIVREIDHASGGPSVQMRAPRGEARAVEDVSNLDLLAAILDGEREQRDALWQMAKEIVRLTEVLEGQDKVLNEIADRAGVVAGGPALGAAASTPRLTAPLQTTRAAAAAAPPPPPPPAPPTTTPTPHQAPASFVFTPPPSAPPPPPVPAPPAPPTPATPASPATAAAPTVPFVPLFDSDLDAPASEAQNTRERETAPLTSSLFGGPPSPLPGLPLPPLPWDRRETHEPAASATPAPAAPAAPAQPELEPAEPRSASSGHDDIERLKAELEAERELVERLRQSKLQLEHRVADAEATLEDRRPQKRQSVLKRLLGSDEPR